MYDGFRPATGEVKNVLAEAPYPAAASGSITGVPSVTDLMYFADFSCETAGRTIEQASVAVHQVKTLTTLFSLNLQPILEGFAPYSNTFTLYGNDSTGHMLAIQNFSTPALAFVKPGHSTSECGIASAVQIVPSGGFVDMNALYGVPKTGLPLGILACREYDGTIPASMNLSVTYDYLD